MTSISFLYTLNYLNKTHQHNSKIFPANKCKNKIALRTKILESTEAEELNTRMTLNWDIPIPKQASNSQGMPN